jgi:hypothetical protein
MDAILAVCQFLLMFGKMLKPCSDARQEQAMQKFVQCDNDVGHWAAMLSDHHMWAFRRQARVLFADMLTVLD